jgi:hypothetical protein
MKVKAHSRGGKKVREHTRKSKQISSSPTASESGASFRKKLSASTANLQRVMLSTGKSVAASSATNKWAKKKHESFKRMKQ